MNEKKDADVEKIIEIRSSFRGSKKRKTYNKANIIGIVIIASVFLGLVISPYWNKTDDNNDKTSSITKKKTEIKSSETKEIKEIRETKETRETKENKEANTTDNIVENIGKQLTDNGFEITIKIISPAKLYTNVWISVKNTDDKEKPFRIGSDSMIIDNTGWRYENVYATGIEIEQTNLSAQTTREGSVFFDRLREGSNPKKLILDINGERIEFTLNTSNS